MNIEPEIELLILATLSKRVAERIDLVKATVGTGFNEGDKRTFRSPADNAKLGVVYRSDPDPAWKVVDRNALAAHLAGDPDNIEYVDDIAGTQEQVLQVLAEHAPHLLARVERVRDDVVQAAVATAAHGGDVAPGIARVKPRGTLSVRPDKNAGDAIERLVAAGVITWDGRPGVLPDGVETVAVQA